MNWCQPHWNQLREVINEKGLGQFVSQNGREAAESLVNNEKFDPLMGCWLRINQQMLESPGLNGRALECPLCILVFDGQPQLVKRWLDGCTDEAVIYAIEKGLMKRS